MEEAVRDLVAKGIRPQRIRISQGTMGDGGNVVYPAPERGSLIGFGLAIGAMAGGTLTLIWMLLLSGRAALPLSLIVLRTLSSAASGALLGALLAVVVFAAHHRKRPHRLDAKPGDFIVTVKPPDESAAEEVRAFLAHHGGDLVPT